jgi:hypothetical protein
MTQSNPSSGAGTTATNPMRTVWSALEAAGHEPHGKSTDFRSRCPVHDGDSPDTLSVSPGADGRALVHCHAHACEVEDITAAIGLQLCDLFPSGHRHARRLGVHPARRADFAGAARDVADTIYALDRLKEDWRAELILQCPGCGSGSALFVASSRHPSFMSCESGCTVEQAAQTLAGQLQDRRAA